MKATLLIYGAGAVLFAGACHPRTQIGDPLLGLKREERRLFDEGKNSFSRTFTPEQGLGPLFNSDSCGECHEDPVLGGSGDEVEVHATKFVPPGFCDPLFQEGGPVIQQQATPLLKAEGVDQEQIPVSATGQARRSTPPVFGFGLVDAIPDETILAYEDPDDADGDGISGRANRFSDGRLGRFGRKAFVPTLSEFNAGAFPAEQGVTTPLQPVEETINGRPVPPNTDPVPEPEVPESEIDAVTDFVRFLAPPPPPEAPGDSSTRRKGEHLFQQVGCARCHVPAMKTGPSEVKALDRKTLYLYSDLLLHDMGPELMDICLGLATPSEFRTELLMGLRLREHFLHDGNADSVTAAIERHGGEAEAARAAFQQLSSGDREALLRFLDSI
jgi:CxxC motif-containing protein (DUF1111 family)